MKIMRFFSEIKSLSNQFTPKTVMRLLIDTWQIIEPDRTKTHKNPIFTLFIKIFYTLFAQSLSLNPNAFFDIRIYRKTRSLGFMSKKFPLFHYLTHSRGSNPLTNWDEKYLEYAPEAHKYKRSLLLHYYLHSDRSFRFIKQEVALAEYTTGFVVASKFNGYEYIEHETLPNTILRITSCASCIIIPSTRINPEEHDKVTYQKSYHPPASECHSTINISITFSGNIIDIALHKPVILFSERIHTLIATYMKGQRTHLNYADLFNQYITVSTNMLKDFSELDTGNIESFYIWDEKQLDNEDNSPHISSVVQRETNYSQSRRVLVISHEDSRTGAPIYLAQIAQELINFGFDIKIISIRDDFTDGVFTNFGERSGYLKDYLDQEYRDSTTSNGWLLNQAGESALKKLLNEFLPDVVLVNSLASSDVVRVCKIHNFSCLVYVHERSTFYDHPNILGTILGNRVIEGLRGSEKVIFGSVATRNYWLSRVPLFQSSVVPTYRAISSTNSSHSANMRIRFRSDLGIDNNCKVFLAIATFEPRKRIADIVIAFKSITDPVARLLLVGDSEIPGSVSQAVLKLAKNDSRIFIFKRQSNLDEFYSGSDYFVHASEEETMPLVLQEAAQWGLPRLIARYEGIEELVPRDDLALTFQIGDIDEMSILMKQLLSHMINEEYMVEAAREYQTSQLRAGTQELVELIKSINCDAISISPLGWAKSC
jgi:glycosyltransferase involved in cell wall biosynthesis